MTTTPASARQQVSTKGDCRPLPQLVSGLPVCLLGDSHRYVFVGSAGDGDAILRDLNGRIVRVAAAQVTVGLAGRIVRPRKNARVA